MKTKLTPSYLGKGTGCLSSSFPDRNCKVIRTSGVTGYTYTCAMWKGSFLVFFFRWKGHVNSGPLRTSCDILVPIIGRHTHSVLSCRLINLPLAYFWLCVCAFIWLSRFRALLQDPLNLSRYYYIMLTDSKLALRVLECRSSIQVC